MFILYAIPLGLLAGLLAGGTIGGLAGLRFRLAWVALAGLALQLVLFSEPVTAVVGDAGVPLYIGSTVLVLGSILANWRIRGLVLVAIGAACNLAAIVANGGYMPADEAAYAEQGRQVAEGYSNTKVIADPQLAFLTDVIVMPGWMPFANVISLGDILIGMGMVVVVVLGMRSAPRRGRLAASAPAGGPAEDPAAA